MGGTERQRRSPTRISVFLTSWPDKENHLQEHLQRVGAGDWHSRADPGRGLTQVVAWAGMSMWRPPRVSLAPLDHTARGGRSLCGTGPVGPHRKGAFHSRNWGPQGPSLLLNLLSLSQGKEPPGMPGAWPPIYLRKCA